MRATVSSAATPSPSAVWRSGLDAARRRDDGDQRRRRRQPATGQRHHGMATPADVSNLRQRQATDDPREHARHDERRWHACRAGASGPCDAATPTAPKAAKRRRREPAARTANRRRRPAERVSTTRTTSAGTSTISRCARRRSGRDRHRVDEVAARVVQPGHGADHDHRQRRHLRRLFAGGRPTKPHAPPASPAPAQMADDQRRPAHDAPVGRQPVHQNGLTTSWAMTPATASTMPTQPHGAGCGPPDGGADDHDQPEQDTDCGTAPSGCGRGRGRTRVRTRPGTRRSQLGGVSLDRGPRSWQVDPQRHRSAAARSR